MFCVFVICSEDDEELITSEPPHSHSISSTQLQPIRENVKGIKVNNHSSSSKSTVSQFHSATNSHLSDTTVLSSPLPFASRSESAQQEMCAEMLKNTRHSHQKVNTKNNSM